MFTQCAKHYSVVGLTFSNDQTASDHSSLKLLTPLAALLFPGLQFTNCYFGAQLAQEWFSHIYAQSSPSLRSSKTNLKEVKEATKLRDEIWKGYNFTSSSLWNEYSSSLHVRKKQVDEICTSIVNVCELLEFARCWSLCVYLLLPSPCIFICAKIGDWQVAF